eukprot:symbB.v1.2.010061.t1/scaffold652.1/size176119/2
MAALNEEVPAETGLKVPSSGDMKDFTKNLSEVKANCASLLEQIAALQAAHEQAVAGISLSEEVKLTVRENSDERPLSRTTLDLLKQPETAVKESEAAQLGPLKKIFQWFRHAPNQAWRTDVPDRCLTRFCKILWIQERERERGNVLIWQTLLV